MTWFLLTTSFANRYSRGKDKLLTTTKAGQCERTYRRNTTQDIHPQTERGRTVRLQHERRHLITRADISMKSYTSADMTLMPPQAGANLGSRDSLAGESKSISLANRGAESLMCLETPRLTDDTAQDASKKSNSPHPPPLHPHTGCGSEHHGASSRHSARCVRVVYVWERDMRKACRHNATTMKSENRLAS
ncbi:hypothetical protein BaRGS_00010190 [Batillaria attramentaria]|uniref:Uncharacterized protein n=1 Tax=Batillaria attramentaria TaxID=370345 RepID=A0ABD0LGG8_9CAEN